MCVFHLSCSVHLDARPIHLMRVFSFRATSCTLQGDLSIPCAYFHFVQQVARYEATYPSHERIFIRATSCTPRGDLSLPHASVFIRATHCMKCGEWCFNVVYFR